MRTLILAVMALAFGAATASAECNWQQTAAKSSVVAKADQTGGTTDAASTKAKPPAS